MTLLRKSASSDVEVELISTKNGEVYNIQIEGHDDQKNLCSTDAYEALAECFKDANVRLPSRFIVEFGQHVLNQLLQKIR